MINERAMRESNLELLRIISMIVIVAHHYVVNSGLMDIIRSNPMKISSIFLLLFGWGGKTAINCYILITGYFMCKKSTTIRKYIKLIIGVIFYNVVIGFIFLLKGYEHINIRFFVNMLLPINNIGHSDSFVTSFLFFFLMIPYLNVMLNSLEKREIQNYLCLLIIVYSLLPSLGFKTVFNSIVWFSVMYIIGAYIRIYLVDSIDFKLCGFASIVLLALSWCSIIVMIQIGAMLRKFVPYWLVNNEGKILALMLSVATFMFFLKLPMHKYKSINMISAATFGVLLIHANSNAMRTWLWKDTLNCTGQYGTPLMVVHAFSSVIGIYSVCTLIELLRIKFLEESMVNVTMKFINSLKGKINDYTSLKS